VTADQLKIKETVRNEEDPEIAIRALARSGDLVLERLDHDSIRVDASGTSQGDPVNATEPWERSSKTTGMTPLHSSGYVYTPYIIVLLQSSPSGNSANRTFHR
jgi:hypothetical protein